MREIHGKSSIEKKENGDGQSNGAITDGGSERDNVLKETSKMPFLMLGLDLPPPPLFKDVMEKNIIPQVQKLTCQVPLRIFDMLITFHDCVECKGFIFHQI